MENGRLLYFLFMVLAFAVFFLTRYLQPARLTPRNLSTFQTSMLGLAAFTGGAYAAKLGAILEQLPREQFSWEISLLLSDGKTITTALVGGYLAVEAAKWVMHLKIKTGDSWALPIAAGLAIGRWGCFFLGCCHGTLTNLPWGVDFSPVVEGNRHPTQIYEVIFHVWCALVLWQLIRRQKLQSHLLQFYLIAYCIFRFFTEWIRPAETYALGLTFYQWVAILFATMLAIQWFWEERMQFPGHNARETVKSSDLV